VLVMLGPALTIIALLLGGWAVSTHVAAQPRSLGAVILSEARLDTAPSAKPTLLARLGRSPIARRLSWSATIHRRWVVAGRPGSVEEWQGRRLAGAVAAAIAVIVLTTMTPLALALAPVAVMTGYRAPSLALARRARVRQARIEAHVPDLIEVLVATTEAGLNPMVAFQRSSEVVRGALGDELARTTRQIGLGTPWRTALEQLEARISVPALRRLVVALARSHRLGTSLSATLRAVAIDLRDARRARAEELARRAPIRMLFPLVFLILPAFLLLTVGPVVLATLRSLH
jgi:tight adherence protein C